MKLKISILYSWFVRTATYFLPNIPYVMRFRGFLYSFMMQKCGKNFQVTSSTIINSLAGLKVGDNVYIGPNTVLIGVDIEIGNEVLIGPKCLISGGNHIFFNKSFRYGKSINLPVRILEGSWVAGNCTITANSVLPERSILAAGAVLTKKYEQADSVYAGVPATYLKPIQK